MDHIAGLPDKEARDYLFLAPSEKFPGRWYVDALDSSFFLDFEEQIGRYRTVAPATLDAFLDRAEDLRYHVMFTEDPVAILSAWSHLNDTPEFSLNSEMENTINGFFPFQLQGFNYLRRAPKGGFGIWSTGTGKTVLETAMFKQHLEHEDFEVGLAVVKRNNKIDTQRKLKALGSIDYAHILDGTPKQREELYEAFLEALAEGNKLVGILNYEKFRDDPDFYDELLLDRRVVIVWDEMPTKLSNRKTILYESVKTSIYGEALTIDWESRRPAWLRQYVTTATPIENSPVGVLNQVRLVDPDVWPTIRAWDKQYVAGRNPFSREPETFNDLDKMGLEIEYMTHQVDKDDPDIAKLFPKVREEIIWVDWSPQDRKIYEQLQDIAIDLAKQAKEQAEALKEGDEIPDEDLVKPINPLQLIGVLQMLCDAPSIVQQSGENRAEFEAALAEVEDEDEYWALSQFVSGSEAARLLLEKQKKPLTNENCNKLKDLYDRVIAKHPGEKGIVFTKLAGYMLPVLERACEAWGVSYVTFRGTEKQRQKAIDLFRSDPEIQILLSSDAGSDSVDLAEASWVADYDLPPTYARKIQRHNRAHRINSLHEYVTFYEMRMPNSVEDRWAEILETKKGYHDAIYGGKINEDAMSARMTVDDLWYVLTGAYPD